MENLKVYVKNEAESKEVQDLFFELGGDFYFGGKLHCNTHSRLVTINKDGLMANLEFGGFDYVEITLQQLRDLVVLKRNDVFDANYESENGDRKYYLTDAEFFEFINGAWVNIDELADGMSFKFIDKEGQVKMKEKEYIAKVPGNWRLVDSHESIIDRIEVPDGAEEYRANYKFYKSNGELVYCSSSGEWTKSIMSAYKTLWQRNTSTVDSKNTSIQDKLKFIEKWLNGEKIQYILGVESAKTQWHNFTEGAMQYIKRSDIKFREAPKYVTINGIEFKSVESLLKHVKNNFDLEDGEVA